MNYFSDEVGNHFHATEQKHVKLSLPTVLKVAQEFAVKELRPPNWAKKGVCPANCLHAISFDLFRDSINFCYRYPENPEEVFKLSGYYLGSESLQRCLYRAFCEPDERPVYPEQILKAMETRESAQKFFQGINLPPLLDERREHLIEVATVLKDKFNSRAENILQEARYNVVKDKNGKPGIIEILTENFPLAFGQDKFGGKKFYKRAQLFAMIYQGRALASKSTTDPNNQYYGLPRLEDPENIGPVADYNVANSLRQLGILKYSEALAEKIDNQRALERHSEEELEIRMGTVTGVSALLRTVNSIRETAGKSLWTMVEVDFPLWKEGRNKEGGPPHHLCLSTDY